MTLGTQNIKKKKKKMTNGWSWLSVAHKMPKTGLHSLAELNADSCGL